MKSKNNLGLNIGSSSILVIFIVLCLVTFATLSMVSANADYKLSKKLAVRTTAYYNANNKAEELLSVVDTSMKKAYKISKNQDDYYQNLAAKLSSCDEVLLGYGDPDICLDYSIPITDKQTLHVNLSAVYPVIDTSKDYYNILSWQVENIDDWVPDHTIELVEP